MTKTEALNLAKRLISEYKNSVKFSGVLRDTFLDVYARGLEEGYDRGYDVGCEDGYTEAMEHAYMTVEEAAGICDE